MSRRRLTWNRKASEPALPHEGHDHPAHQGQQPVEKYFIDNDGNGVGSEPSDFAEDVHPAPYSKGEEPAIPHEGHDHPAMKAAARDIRASVERKASKCIRIAQATLGKTASIEDVEDQALAFMNMADEDVEATLDRLSEMEATYAQEEQATSMFAEEDAELEGMMAEFLAEMEDEDHMGGNHMAEKAEEYMGEEDAEAEAMLSEMLAEMEAPMADQNDPTHFEAQHAEEEVEAMEDELMLAEEGLDAMGLGDEMNDDELLAGLFAGKFAADEEEAEEKEEEKEDAEEEKAEDKEEEKADKKASRLRPRARKASKGVKTLGTVSKAASSNEMSELSKLWESAPDITDMF